MHWPKISEKKKLELAAIKETIKTSPLRGKKSPKSIYGSEHPGDISHKGDHRANSEQDAEKSIMQRKKVIWPENPLKPKPKEMKEPKIVDYLKE